MSFFVRLSAVTLATMTAACATHPLPEDFSRKTTRDIVQRILCEVSTGLEDLSGVSDAQLRTTSIGLDFELEMIEENDATAGKIGLTNPISGGKVLIDLNASAEKTRENKRRFRIVDTMYNLRLRNDCSDDYQRVNFVYPITGHVGLAEVLDTYWALRNQYPVALIEKTQQAFVETLTYTTTFTGGISPNITLNAGATSLHVSNFSIDGKLLRTDNHILTLAILPEQQSPPSKSARRTTGRPALMFAPVNKGIDDALDAEILRRDLRDSGRNIR